MIECARQVAIERRLQIELALGDASSTGLPRSSFDLVHARLVLGNILAREQVVKRWSPYVWGHSSAAPLPES
jgi:ubiquinone/menaquinone biosynthesis C-methylase UbiE